ncbi:MAG: hypothetical protein JNM51_17405, partial [Bacteroidia bacterium]|nr:hypothetical protein [Bacteroidia bacterium]
MKAQTPTTYSVLNTAYDRATNSYYPLGSIDNYWFLTKIEDLVVPNNPASVINYPNAPTYVVPNVGNNVYTGIIANRSINANATTTSLGLKLITFRTYFNLPNLSTTNNRYSLSFKMSADDAVNDVKLNGTLKGQFLSSTYNNIPGITKPYLLNIPICDTDFVSGQNYIDVTIADAGGSVGFYGEVTLFEVTNPFNMQLTSSAVCNGLTATASTSLSTTLPNPQITYTWLNSSGVVSQTNNSASYINSISNLSNGNYTVIAQVTSSSGCVSTTTVGVSINCVPTPTVPVTSFSSPDTVCVNQQFNVIDQSIGATTYYWNFCQGNTSTVPQGINLGNIGAFNGPVFMSIAKDGTDYYAFVCNNSVSTITKLFFGSSLMNTPVATNLGNVGGVLPGNLEDIHLELENGNWFGIVTGGMSGGERIVRLNFGSTLANIPTATNFGNIGGLSYPQRIKVFQSGGSYYGFIVNRDNNTITRISFGSSLSNTPTGINLGNIGALNIPDALGMINLNNSWYGYVINEGNNTISRLDFGTSLLNIPTGTNLGNTGALNGPRAIDMWTECGQIKGLITNRYSNDILDMNFLAGPTGPVSTVSYGNIAGFSFPHSITRFRSGDTLYAFITNVNNNSLSRLFFA